MKNKTTATVLAFLLGGLGIHNFYLGKNMKGALCLLFFWTYIPFILAIIDGIKLLLMRNEDFTSKYNPLPSYVTSRNGKNSLPIDYSSNPEAEDTIEKARKEAEEIRKEANEIRGKAKKYYQKKVAEADEIVNNPGVYIEQQYIKQEEEQVKEIEKVKIEKDKEIDRERRKREELEQKIRKEELKREQEEREREEQKKREEKAAKKRAKEIKFIEGNIQQRFLNIRSRELSIKRASDPHQIDGYKRGIIFEEREIEKLRKQIEKIQNSK